MSYLILYLDPSVQNRPHKRFAVMWAPERTQPVLCGSSESGELYPDSSPWLSHLIWKKNAEYAEFAINHSLLQQLHRSWMTLFEFRVTQHGCNSVTLKQLRSCSVSPPPPPVWTCSTWETQKKNLDRKRKKWRWSMAHEGERMIEVVCGLGWGPPFKVKLIHWPLQDEVQANIHLALQRVLEAYSQ